MTDPAIKERLVLVDDHLRVARKFAAGCLVQEAPGISSGPAWVECAERLANAVEELKACIAESVRVEIKQEFRDADVDRIALEFKRILSEELDRKWPPIV